VIASMSAALVWLTAAAAVLLIAAYGIGAPFVLLRTVLLRSRRHRLRYRTRNDDVLATSRFTIPVSLIVPLDAETPDAVRRIRALLQLRYPELEVIVVISGAKTTLEDLRDAFVLTAAEVFYRKSLPSAAVRSIFRSTVDSRVLVIDVDAAPTGALLNCGANLARYRYLAAFDAHARFKNDALLETMQAALEEPQRVVGVLTNLTVAPVEAAENVLDGAPQTGLLAGLNYLAAARARLLTIGRRRLDLPVGGCPGFSVWRRDVVIDVGGFGRDGTATHADMVFRVHQHFRGDRQRYRVIHVSEPVGTVDTEAAERLVRAARVPASLLWHHRTMFLNPALGRLGLWDLPRYAFNQLLAPWIEFAALLLLVAAVPLHVLTAGELLLVLFIVGLGNGVLTASALLLTTEYGAHAARPAALFNLLLAGPLEYFTSRPALLMDRFRRNP
jgi:cellulose synthase/poly-beta-1,6-N-acetylglucosamine synthase-like glycosyltransferase